MARAQVCCVFDRAINGFGRPFFVAATGQAVRSFQDEVRNPDSEIAKHPSDFDLYHLGDFDDGPGRFSQFEAPVLLVRAQDLVTSVA